MKLCTVFYSTASPKQWVTSTEWQFPQTQRSSGEESTITICQIDTIMTPTTLFHHILCNY